MSSLTGNQGMRGESGASITTAPSGHKQKQMQNFTPQAMKLYESMFANVGPDSQLSKLANGDEETFSKIEAPAYKQFNALQGDISSRFSGMGMGARRGSGFQNSMNQASVDFSSELQARRQDMMRQAMKDLHEMSNSLLNQKPYENYLEEEPEKEREPWEQFIGGILPVASAAGAAYFSGGDPAMTKIGYQAGKAGSQAFMS